MPIRKRRNGWYIDIYVDGRRVRKSAGTTDEHAARILEQTMLGLHRGTTPRQKALEIVNLVVPEEHRGVLVADLVEWYSQCLKDERSDIGSRTIRQRLANVRMFADWTAANTDVRYCEEVAAEQAFAYSRMLGGRGILGKTLNAYCGELSTVWKMLLKRGKAKENPWQYVRVRRDRENEHTGRAFTREEVERLIEVARRVGHDWEGMVVVGAYTGLRMPDVANLRWRGDPRTCLVADLANRRIHGTPSKTARHGTQVDIRMHDRVYALLSFLPQDGDWVLPWRHAHPAGYKARGDDRSFAQILAEAEVGKVDERDKMSFHCLRHTFVSWLAEAGVSQEVRMKLAGHTQSDTHAIYDHDRTAADDAIGKLK